MTLETNDYDAKTLPAIHTIEKRALFYTSNNLPLEINGDTFWRLSAWADALCMYKPWIRAPASLYGVVVVLLALPLWVGVAPLRRIWWTIVSSKTHLDHNLLTGVRDLPLGALIACFIFLDKGSALPQSP
ncbi:hypothetical protein WJX84_006413 [Apatococcus fuscideae]|uniref:Uncharacterized protein n=1 Tax=Apatococcus fuscideae TaxID=2026836 RepID=A0AAW1RTI8_9CHLO